MADGAALSALDSAVLGPLHTSPQLRAVLGEEGLLVRYLRTEVALAEAQADLGMIPVEVPKALASVSVDDLDLARLADRTASVGYPIVGVVEQLAELAPDGLGEFAHWGATTQDIMDTAVVLQIRDALDLIETDLVALIRGLCALATSHADTPMVARSQMQQSLPTTVGYRAAGWLEPILHHLDRLPPLRTRVEVVQLGGAVGTLASIEPKGLEARRALADQLDLGEPLISWHSARDRMSQVVAWAALLCASLAKIGLDIALSAQTEIAEFSEGAGGISSTMPHKRNPILSQQLIRSAKLTRTHLDLVLDAAIADHDRATAAWSLEWHAIAPALGATGGAVAAAVELLSDLQVHSDAMADNLEATGGLIMAEAIMMRLAPELGRQAAHDKVDAMVEESVASGRPFVQIVTETAPDALPALDPAAYLGHATEQVEAVLATAAQTLADLDRSQTKND